MTKKKTTLKNFVTQASSAKSAMGFLKAKGEFIRQYSFLATILDSYERGEVLASPTLKAITDIAFKHMLNADIEKAKERGAKTESVPRVSKAYLVSIFDNEGNVIEDKTFDLFQECQGWADRRMFENAECSHANIEGHRVMTKVSRQDSIARVLQYKRGSVMKQNASKTSALSFRPTVKEDRAYFSRG